MTIEMKPDLIEMKPPKLLSLVGKLVEIMGELERVPKRGFNNVFRVEYAEVNLDRIQQAIDAKQLDAGAVINAESLVKAGVLRRAKAGVRLLGRGEIKEKVTVEVHGASKSAIAAVEKAGGSVKLLAPAKEEGEAA